MGHFFSLPLKRPSPPLANTGHPPKRRKTFHRGDGDDQQEETPSCGYSGQQVFLSHSGHQKSFVEQLFVDLQRENISCFFDKHPDSLPKGENFPTLIFEAAEKCRVGVVVVSNEFISSKWPMQELCAFVRAQNSTNPRLKILPVSFGLTPDALSKRLQKKETLKRSWEKLLDSQKRPTNLDEWVSALEALRPINGLVYSQQEGEVAYRAQIVTAIRRLVPPKLLYADSCVQGKERLCQIVAELFNNTPRGEHGVKIAGLYGVAGIGKTTLSRIACNFYSNEFEGRVLHVELGKEGSVQRLRCALRNLTDASETLVHSVSDVEEGWHLFNRRMMHARKVFLAMDNISDLVESTEEAQKYVAAVRSAGNQSKILLTSRSSTILRRFISEGEGWCIHVPSLEEEEAVEVLLQLTPLKVSNLSSEEQDIAKKCALECYFHWHCTHYEPCHGVPIRAYHPLALKSFGALLYERFNSCTDLSQWIEIQNLSKPWRSGHMLEEIFGILEESFLRLRKDSREVFMLLSLYMPQPDMTSEAAFDWLALACDRDVQDIKLAMVELKRKGFVESIREYGDGLYIHDLHKEFAENKADGTEKWISVKSRHIPASLQEALSSDRPRFSAMKFDSCHFQCPGFVNDELFRNVLVLHLQDMPQLKILNLSTMKIVRSITIVGCEGMQEICGLETLTNLVYFLVTGCSTNLQFSGIEGLSALEHLQVDARHQARITESSPLSWTSFPPLQSGSIVADHIENGAKRLDLTSCSRLRTIKLSGCDMVEIDLTGCLELTKIEIMDCKNLSEISLFNSNLIGLEVTTVRSALTSESLPRLGPAFFNFTEIRLVRLQNLKELPAFTELTALRDLWLEEMHSLKELPAFTRSTALGHLHLEGMHSLKELPALTRLTALQVLVLKEMHSLNEVPALTGLTELLNLRLEGMHGLKKLPSLTGLTELLNLQLEGMHSLKELPALTGLTALKNLRLEGMHSLKEIPALTMLPALLVLVLKEMHSLKELPALTGLTALRHLRLEEMYNLKELPALTGLTALWDLRLEGMHSLKELPALTGLPELEKLELEGMHSMKELPALTGLTALRHLRLEGMHSLKEFPALIGLTMLNQLQLEGMHSLKELPSLTGLPALWELRLTGMHSLKELPALTGLPALWELRLEGMHSLKELPALTGLSALERLELEGMHSLKELPALTGLPALRHLELKGMHSLKELPTFIGLTALGYLQLEGMYNLKELPAFTGLPALWDLRLEGMHSLKELPALTGLTALSRLKLEGMHNLKELPAFTPLPALWDLRLEGMHSLKDLPALTGLTELQDLRLEGMHSLKELPAFTGLTALRDLRLEGMHSLTELPALTGLTALGHLQLEGMHNLKEFPDLTGLPELCDLRLEGMHSMEELSTFTRLTAL